MLTTPVIRALHNQLEGEVEIHYLTKKKFASLLEAHPGLYKIHTIENSVQEILPELEKTGFDYIVDLHHNIRSRIVKKRLKSLSFTFKKLNIRKWILVNFGIDLMPDKHIVDRYLDTLKPFGIVNDQKGLEYYIPEGKGIGADFIPPAHRNGYIAFVVGGAHFGKRMDAEKLKTLCDSIQYPIVLLGGEEDAELTTSIVSSEKHPVFNACGKTTLHQSADIIRNAKLVITGDTGMMHIASAFEKKIISLWGCTTPQLGMSPWHPHPDSIIVEPRNRKRRPCSKLGNRCKYGSKNRCIQAIDNGEILEAIKKLWVLK